jgi:hypothetical protein
MEIGLPSLDSSSSNSDKELISEIKEENWIVVQVGATLSTLGIFHTNKIGGGQWTIDSYQCNGVRCFGNHDG